MRKVSRSRDRCVVSSLRLQEGEKSERYLQVRQDICHFEGNTGVDAGTCAHADESYGRRSAEF